MKTSSISTFHSTEFSDPSITLQAAIAARLTSLTLCALTLLLTIRDAWRADRAAKRARWEATGERLARMAVTR